MYECKVCNKHFELKQSYAGHLSAHKRFGKNLKEKKKIVFPLNEEWKQENGLYKCPECGIEKVKNGICTHIFMVHTEAGSKHNEKIHENKISWNKGQTKDTNESIARQIKTFNERIKSGIIIPKKGPKHSEEFKVKQSIVAKARKLGGHTSKKSLYYEKENGKVIYLQSSYEVEVAKELDLHKIKWERPTYFLWIDENNVSHRYYPDFYLPEFNFYLDPKNDFLIRKDAIKIKKVSEQNKILLLMLNKYQLRWDTIKSLYSSMVE